MKRTTKYVAFDVHQATTVASVRDDSGRVLARSVLETHGGQPGLRDPPHELIYWLEEAAAPSGPFAR